MVLGRDPTKVVALAITFSLGASLHADAHTPSSSASRGSAEPDSSTEPRLAPDSSHEPDVPAEPDMRAEPDTSAEPKPEPEPEPVGDDEVTLEGGGFVRGTIVELVPQSHVVIVVGGTNEPRRIERADIERIERGKHARERPSTPEKARAQKPPAKPSKDPEAPAKEPGKPRVHLQVREGSSVGLFEIGEEVRSGGPHGPTHGMRYRRLCTAPCGKVVDGTSGRSFFLGQDIWTASRRFELDEYTGDLTIAVRPGSKALRIVGAALLGVATGVAIAGGVFVFAENTRTTGLALLGSGAAGLLISTPMLVFGRTRYELVKKQK